MYCDSNIRCLLMACPHLNDHVHQEGCEIDCKEPFGNHDKCHTTKEEFDRYVKLKRVSNEFIKFKHMPLLVERLYVTFNASLEQIDEFMTMVWPEIKQWTNEHIDEEFNDFLTK